MKRYRQLLIYGLIILMTIGSYIGYTLSIQGADLSLETVSGKPSQVENFNLRLQTKGMRSTVYDVDAKGAIEKQSNSYVGQLFREDSMTDLPDKYYEFTTQMSVGVGNRNMRFRLNTINCNLRCLRSRQRKCSRRHFSMIQNLRQGGTYKPVSSINRR